MSDFDFSTPIDRRNGDSTKWNRYAGRDVLPLWVADMDFAAPPAVLDALRRRTDHGVFGYAQPWPGLVDAVVDHLRDAYRWRIDPAWIVWIPGVVAAFNVVCRAVGETGDAVFTATPVYPPFLTAPQLSGRRLASEALVRDGGRWGWDFAATEKRIAGSRAKLWLLCHPHNPVGRAWNEAELAAIGALAEKYGLTVCSDEIHGGLVLDPAVRHVPLAALSPQLAQRTVTLIAPSKTFNIPGLYCALAIVPDPALRRRMHAVMDGIMPAVNTLGLVATEAAFRECADWHAALIETLRANAARVAAAVAQMPGLAMTPVEATYLAWIDCRGLGVDAPQKFFEQAGVGLSDGGAFGLGDDYRQFVRLNFACPAALLDEALGRMARAVAAARQR